MIRRRFLKTLFSLPAALLGWKALSEKECGQFLFITRTVGERNWKFYINSKEIDGRRATNGNGDLYWPFQGAKKGDLCIAKSPVMKVIINKSDADRPCKS